MRVSEFADRLNDEEDREDAEVGLEHRVRRLVRARAVPQRGGQCERERQHQFPLRGVQLPRELIAAERLEEVDDEGHVLREIPEAEPAGDRHDGQVTPQSEHLHVDARADGARVRVRGPSQRGDVRQEREGRERSGGGRGGERRGRGRQRVDRGTRRPGQERPRHDLEREEGDEREPGYTPAVLGRAVAREVPSHRCSARGGWPRLDATHFPRKEAFPTRFIDVTGKAAAVVNARRRALASVVGRRDSVSARV